MTRDEAMRFLVSTGKPIRHRFFSKGEYVRYDRSKADLTDEEGHSLPQIEFFALRSGGNWEDGWEEYKGQ